MSTNGLFQEVVDPNLSTAWLRAFALTARQAGGKCGLLAVSVTSFDHGVPKEDPSVRTTLDAALSAAGAKSCATTAGTIFPTSLWNPQMPRTALFERYRRIWPRIRRAPGNHRSATYFSRLIGARADTAEDDSDMRNQLEHIIATYLAGNHRVTALQASVFDPRLDHTNQRRLGFPCLQHLVFAPDSGGLSVTALYAQQYLFDRAYGNYLGLCAVGRFVGHELRLPLVRMTCIAVTASIGNITKQHANDFLAQCPGGLSA